MLIRLIPVPWVNTSKKCITNYTHNIIAIYTRKRKNNFLVVENFPNKLLQRS